jgi:3-oxoacyl-[acyl-carrier-protein] synthase II
LTGFVECKLFSTEKLSTRQFGEISGDFPPASASPTCDTRLKSLAREALAEAMSDGGLNRAQIAALGTRAWLCFGTLLATTDPIMEYATAKKSGKTLPGYLENINDYLPHLRDLCGVKGASFVSSAACAASTMAAGMAYDFIGNGMCDLCVVGGADPLTKMAAYGFHSLKLLSGGLCNPFDENRDGINIGEGAAFFIFEEYEAALSRGARIYAEVMGYGLANDAYHVTSPDPEGLGVIHAMKESLREAGLVAGDVSHVNAHGTGTPINDQMELQAIEKLYGDAKKPSITSTKALIGHCMGASGAIELAALVMAVKNQAYMPLPNLERPIETDCFIDSVACPYEINYGVSNSYAFAGNIASVLVGRSER